MLVIELAYADEALTPADRQLIEQHLRDRWGLVQRPATSSPALPVQSKLRQYRERLRGDFGRTQRLALIESMWQAAFADGAIGVQGDRVIQRAGELLGLAPEEVSEAVRGSRATLSRVAP
jgi:hypothetical protein